ncbi:MAG: hypothetical protein M1822_002357 [Bathelium mastoideum]|nr:MAG: hypothetical protein M1822_002357 [Bathelium mastoideum]
MATPENVEFKTIDGVMLRGVVFPARTRGPGIILSPAFNAVKEMLGLYDAARVFQDAQYTALLYDCRSVGQSDGQPRNDIDPSKQVEDYSDALSFFKDHPTVDSKQIFFWGMSLSGSVALSAACLDKRAAGVICVCPIVELQYDRKKLPQVLQQCMRDRESQLKGNAPFYLPMLNSDGYNPAGFDTGIDREHSAKIVIAGKELAPTHVNRTTIQSYSKTVMWKPFPLWALLDPTPVCFVVPELDRTCPAELQLRCFNNLLAPKELRVCNGRNHMDILESSDFQDVMNFQINFVRSVLNGKLKNG